MLIVAMIIALGGHWAVLQSVAWTTMVIDNAKSAHLAEAIAKTFDGDHPCPLCKSIEKGRASEKKQDLQVATAKMNLFYEATRVVLLRPGEGRWRQARDVFARNLPAQPLLQPPRASLA